MSKTKEKSKQKNKRECEHILEFLFNGQNPLEVIKIHQDKKEKQNRNAKKIWFFAQ